MSREKKRELALFQAFYGAGKPILGICRGMQIINVALGGTLIQDLPRPQRDFHTWDGADKVHPIACLEGSLLHRLYGPLCSVNSAHHQGLDRLGEGLRIIAWSERGRRSARLPPPGPPVSPGAHVLCPPPPRYPERRGHPHMVCGALPERIKYVPRS